MIFDSRICDLCQENYGNVVSACGHSFHHSCLKKLTDINHKKCPKCKTNITQNQLIERILCDEPICEKSVSQESLDVLLEFLFCCARNNIEIPYLSLSAVMQRCTELNWKVDAPFKSCKMNLLYAACENGHVEIVREMIKLGADLNYSSSDRPRNVPLLVACRNNRVEIANLLLDNGASLELFDIENDFELNFLHEAFVGGNLKLIDRIICMKSKDQHENLDIIDRIIKLGSGLKGEGYTMLHAACAAGNLRLFNLFIERGLDIHAKYKNSFSTVHCAVAGGNENILKILMEKEVDYSSCPSTLLHVAAKYDQLDMLKNLIKSGKFDIDAVDNNGNTALHLACKSSNENITLFLMNSDADIEIKDLNGKTAIDYFYNYPLSYPINIALYHHKILIRTWFWACKNKFNLNVADDMIWRHFFSDYNVLDERGRTGLFYVIENFDFDPFDDFAEYMYEKFDTSVRDDEGRTVYHIICMTDKRKIFNLISWDCDWNIPDNYGKTPFHYAAEFGSPDLIEFLFSQYDGKFIDSEGNTLLHLASKYGNHKIFDVLFDKGNVNVDDQNNEGRTSLHLAVENGHLEAVKYLKKKGTDKDSNNN